DILRHDPDEAGMGAGRNHRTEIPDEDLGLVLRHRIGDLDGIAERYPIGGKGKSHRVRKENPGTDVLQASQRDILQVLHRSEIKYGVKIDFVIPLPATESEVRFSANAIDESVRTATRILVVVTGAEPVRADGVKLPEFTRENSALRKTRFHSQRL